eukprot:TRINITY_DN3720_c0_g1_i4.p2 TRINITY_DN3720_c0_g1~~TRINITY_DN3720_c0_g1_i4.p2  ORF type:complete len:103 (-),score=18.40 TRINITY_DN3720_c0_g1_i4:82-390(-)
MQHRGATGCEVDTGDGAGVLTAIPDRFFRTQFPSLPNIGRYGIGVCFMPNDPAIVARLRDFVHQLVQEEGLSTLFWRKVPTDPSALGPTARATQPWIEQVRL